MLHQMNIIYINYFLELCPTRGRDALLFILKHSNRAVILSVVQKSVWKALVLAKKYIKYQLNNLVIKFIIF